jgi:cathepsin X
MGGACTEIDIFPNATVAEYGMVDEGDVDAIKTELYVRGPVAATVNAEPLLEYKGGIYTDDSEPQQTNHIVSIVGWGTEDGQEYWIVRNSWVSFFLLCWLKLSFSRCIVLSLFVAVAVLTLESHEEEFDGRPSTDCSVVARND